MRSSGSSSVSFATLTAIRLIAAGLFIICAALREYDENRHPDHNQMGQDPKVPSKKRNIVWRVHAHGSLLVKSFVVEARPKLPPPS
jgi:hypothetical protein